MSPTPLYLLEVHAYDVGGAAPITLRFAGDPGFTTLPSETPASTYYERRLIQPGGIKRSVFKPGSSTPGETSIDVGVIEILNGDGAMDAMLTYGYGLPLTLRRGLVGAAYPSGFDTILAGTALGVETSGDSIVVKTRSLQYDLAQPFQATKYDGDNVLPDGLEGVEADLLGKPKPVCLGSVLNVSAPCVNTSKLIYQVNDSAIQSLDAVYDSGVALSTGAQWTAHATGRSGNYTACAYGNSLYLIAGQAGVLATSPDATTWTARTSGFGADNINGLAYGAGIYVAVGGSGKLYSSPDGVTWTSRTSGFGADSIQGVIFANSLFIAFGASGKVSTSSNGTSWTLRTTPAALTSSQWNAAAFGNQMYVVVGQIGSTVGVIMSSPDGTTWTQRVIDAPSSGYGAVAFGNGLFALQGGIVGGAGTLALTSNDGITWLRNPSDPFGGNAGAMAFGRGVFAFVASTGLYSSPDGVGWTLNGHPYSTATDLCFDGSNFFSVALTTSVAIASQTSYANLTDLQDDTKAPEAGSYIAYLAGGYFRLGSPPAGQITADVTQGANAAARTAAQLVTQVLTKAGKSAGTAAGDWIAGDITAADTADSSERGVWISEETTFAEVIDQLASPNFWWGLDRQGRYRFKEFTAPSGSSTFSIVANDMKKGSFNRVTLRGDDSEGVPTYRTIVRYQKNHTVQTSGVAGAVSDDRRGVLAKEWREAIDEDTAVQTAHALAVETIYETALADAADAATLAGDLQVLRGTLRQAYDLTVPMVDFGTVDLGDVGTLTHPRYGFSGGQLVRVIDVLVDGKGEWVTLRLWR